MKRKKRYLPFPFTLARPLGMAALLGTALLSSAVLSGCQKEQAVIIRETAGESAGNSDDGGSMAGFETSGSSDRGENTGDSGTSGSFVSLRAQTEAPDTYQARVQTDTLELTADAPVLLPDAANAPTWEFSPAVYEDSQIAQMTAALEEAGVPMDQVSISRNGQTVLPNANGRFGYQLSIHDGKPETEDGEVRSAEPPTPIFWLSCVSTTAASDGDFDANDLTDFSLSAQEEERLRASLEKKAEDLLDSMNLSHLVLRDFQWKRLRSSDPESQDYKFRFSGGYGLQLRYTLSVGNIPVTDSRSSYFNGSLPSSQYIEILYSQDGQLLVFKDIGLNTVGNPLDQEPFLLPFTAMKEIFEQQCRAWPAASDSGSAPYIRGTVTKVALEYLPQYEASGGGSLIPVWNFYGSLESAGDGQGTEYRTVRSLLLSISALDGQIMGEPDHDSFSLH